MEIESSENESPTTERAEPAEYTIPGTDIVMTISQEFIPVKTDYPFPYHDPNPWLPKTDWSRDGIIANDD